MPFPAGSSERGFITGQGTAYLLPTKMQTTLNLTLKTSPGVVTRLDRILTSLRKVSPVNTSPILAGEIVRAVKELEGIRSELDRLLCPRFDARATANGEGKPRDFAEVKLYAAKIGLPELEAEKFWNYFAAKGWRVGNHVMKSWHHALVNWKIHWEERRSYQPTPPVNGAMVARDREIRQLEKLSREL